MKMMKRGDVGLAFEDTGGKAPPIILLHGLGCNHTFLSRQAEFFARSRRVVSVDLRGHGVSDAPPGEYTMTVFSEDLVWLCEELDLIKPTVVGHSMGGNIALILAAFYPNLLSSVVLVDSVVFPSASLLAALRPLDEAMREANYLLALKQTLRALCLPTDTHTEELLEAVKGPQHVLASALLNQVAQYDSAFAASGCRIPAAYIAGATSLCDLESFQRATPQLITGKTLGAGHFSPIEVPDQINAMIERFLAMTDVDRLAAEH